MTAHPNSDSSTRSSPASTRTQVCAATTVRSANDEAVQWLIGPPAPWNRTVPSIMVPASDHPCISQRFGRPWVHIRQAPQYGSHVRITWSPGATFVTPAPTASTTPAPSWPKMAGSGQGNEPSMVCRSEWQTPLAASRTATSPARGPSISTSSIASGAPTSRSTAARIRWPPGSRRLRAPPRAALRRARRAARRNARGPRRSARGPRSRGPTCSRGPTPAGRSAPGP